MLSLMRKIQKLNPETFLFRIFSFNINRIDFYSLLIGENDEKKEYSCKYLKLTGILIFCADHLRYFTELKERSFIIINVINK